MTNGTSSRGSMSRVLVAGAATAALAIGALAMTAAPASAAAAVTASQTSDLVYAGQQVTVKGTGYVAGTTLYVTVCDTAKPPGSACDFSPANFAEATVDASGAFTADITAKGSFGAPGPATDCLDGVATCAIVTSNKINPGDFASYVTLPITFAHLSLSKTTIKVGETVTLTGTHYPAAPGTLWVSVCADPPAANNCNMDIPGGAVGQLAYDGSGSFTTTYTLKSSSCRSRVGGGMPPRCSPSAPVASRPPEPRCC